MEQFIKTYVNGPFVVFTELASIGISLTFVSWDRSKLFGFLKVDINHGRTNIQTNQRQHVGLIKQMSVFHFNLVSVGNVCWLIVQT
jgi:hypothetical protein